MLLLLTAAAPEPDGYRMVTYNAPVPETLTGATVVDAQHLAEAIRAGAIAVDVLPAPRRPPGTQIWLPPPRMDIPGSVWWPDVGRGEIDPKPDRWFRDRLAAVTSGDTGHAVAFYCKADCWMSWNAAKRAVGYGYRNVLWFPGGTEAWVLAGYPLQQAEAEPVPIDP